MMKSIQKDSLIRHPADSAQWKYFDELHEDFAKHNRHFRLGYGANGFNPFRSNNVNFCVWPVILIPYTFPPWMCMKQSIFLSHC